MQTLETRYYLYIAQHGDMFDSIAMSAYNEERMASYIIAANPDYCDVIVFEGGEKLRIPIYNQTQTKDSLPPWRRT